MDEAEAIELMEQDDFTADGPIILAQDPGISYDTEAPLQARAELTDKTAETIALRVTTNKNSAPHTGNLSSELVRSSRRARCRGH